MGTASAEKTDTAPQPEGESVGRIDPKVLSRILAEMRAARRPEATTVEQFARRCYDLASKVFKEIKDDDDYFPSSVALLN